MLPEFFDRRDEKLANLEDLKLNRIPLDLIIGSKILN